MNIKELKEKVNNLKNEVISIQSKINEQTEQLQNDLKTKQNDLEEAKLELSIAEYSKMEDKSIHPMERLVMWFNYDGKSDSEWVPDNGVLWDWLNNHRDHERHTTVNLVQELNYLFGIIGKCIPELDDNIELDLDNLKQMKMAFDSWDKNIQDRIENIINDIIKQNINTFVMDW